MIKSFANELAQKIFEDKKGSKAVRKFPSELYRVARRKLLYLYDVCELDDLKVPPGNRLESLKGDLKGYFSIRINNQWGVVYKWDDGASEVQILDYHK